MPVNCNLILYRFLLEADKVTVTTKFTPREIFLAQEIYDQLREVKERQDRRSLKFAAKPAKMAAAGELNHDEAGLRSRWPLHNH